MRRLGLSLLLLFGVAEAREYLGTGGWNIPFDSEQGKLRFVYATKEWWKTDYYPSSASFTLAFDFANPPRGWLPNNLTVRGNIYFDNRLDEFEGGGIYAADDWHKVIGWYNCRSETNERRICNLSFLEGKNSYGERVWLKLQKTFENGTLCYLSGYMYECQWCDEQWLVWNSKRLCN